MKEADIRFRSHPALLIRFQLQDLSDVGHLWKVGLNYGTMELWGKNGTHFFLNWKMFISEFEKQKRETKNPAITYCYNHQDLNWKCMPGIASGSRVSNCHFGGICTSNSQTRPFG